MHDFARMAGAVQHRARDHSKRVDVHAEPFDRSPVDHQSVHLAVFEDDVLDAHRVEDLRSGMNRAVDQGRRHLHRIERIVSRISFYRLMTDSELLEDMNSRLLHHHFIEEHAAAPGSAAGCKFALENRHLQTGVGHVLRSDQRRRATADNRDVDDQVGEQFFGKLPHNRGGDHILNRHFAVPFQNKKTAPPEPERHSINIT